MHRYHTDMPWNSSWFTVSLQWRATMTWKRQLETEFGGGVMSCFYKHRSPLLHSSVCDRQGWAQAGKDKESMKWSEVAQSCPILCNPMDCSPPGSSVHGILQARILEWVALSFSRGSSWPRDQTQVSRIGGRRFNLWATRETPKASVNRHKVHFKTG